LEAQVEDFSHDEKLTFEKEFLGLYLTSHPQLDNLMKLREIVSHELEALEENRMARVKTGGIIDSIRRIFTKRNNNEMLLLQYQTKKDAP